MPSNVQILQIRDASDGTGARPAGDSMSQNDAFFMEKIAARWAKDRNLSSAFDYRLDRLPQGYAGFERARSNSSQIDRFLWGHPGGAFRSLNESYPHFKHLQDFGGPVGCLCVRCNPAAAKKRSSIDGSAMTANNEERSKYFPQQPETAERQWSRSRSNENSRASDQRVEPEVGLVDAQVERPSGQSKDSALPLQNRPRETAYVYVVPEPAESMPSDPAFGGLPEGRYDSDDMNTPRGKQIDDDGTQDIYRELLDQMKAAGSEGEVDEQIADLSSPDWRASHKRLDELLLQLQALPSYVPRVGELVIFTRSEGPIAWNPEMQTFYHIDPQSQEWLSRPRWEAGVVTQMPMQSDFNPEEDLKSSEIEQSHNVTYYGFRLEPMSSPNDTKKSLLSIKYKYVPLQAIRPFSLWKECITGLEEKEIHQSFRHALTISSSFCVVSRHAFKGKWPDATIFARGMFLGAEFFMVGDAVRLMPASEGRPAHVTDILVITSIRLQFVDLDRANDDDYDSHEPYVACLHVRGRPYTLDVRRSWDGVGKSCVAQPAMNFPAGLEGYGQWYHTLDPGNPQARLEVPYTRLMGRCYSSSAVNTWFAKPATSAKPLSFLAVNAKPSTDTPAKTSDISRGLTGVLEARTFGAEHDKRIDRAAGKRWFWADSRIEQLDLYEVNNRSVGIKDSTRDRARMNAWRKALKVLDGKKGGLEEYHAARMKRQEEEQSKLASSTSARGMVASAQPGPESASTSENEESDARHVHETFDVKRAGAPTKKEERDIVVISSEDDD